MNDERNILIMVGTVSSDPMPGDYLRIVKGRNKGKIIQVWGVKIMPDKYNGGKPFRLIISTSGLTVPANACVYEYMSSYNKFKKGRAS